MATNDVGLITVSNQWTKLEDLVKSQVSNTFAFIEGIPYRIQNIGNTQIIYRETATIPSSSAGGVIHSDPTTPAVYKLGANPLYVKTHYGESILYISTEKDM